MNIGAVTRENLAANIKLSTQCTYFVPTTTPAQTGTSSSLPDNTVCVCGFNIGICAHQGMPTLTGSPVGMAGFMEVWMRVWSRSTMRANFLSSRRSCLSRVASTVASWRVQKGNRLTKQQLQPCPCNHTAPFNLSSHSPLVRFPPPVYTHIFQLTLSPPTYIHFLQPPIQIPSILY